MIADLPHLQKLSGLTRRSDIRKWLSANGVAFLVQPSGAPVTTLDAINRAMYGNDKYQKPDFTEPPCSRQKFAKNTAAITSSTKENGIHSPASATVRPLYTRRSRLGHQTGQRPTGNS